MSYTKSDPSSIQSLFNSIAPYYDRTNTMLSFGLHQKWNCAFIKKVGQPKCLLDLCAGTGEIAYGFLENTWSDKAYLLDFSEKMLKEAKRKSERLGIHPERLEFIQGDAQEIPLPDMSVDAVTIAYGIRNIKEPIKCMKEAYRVLKWQGKFGILELTRPNSAFLRYAHSGYLHLGIPLLGKLLTRNRKAYRYLCNSIHHFVDPQELRHQLFETGFARVELIPLHAGIATILIATKR